MGIRDTLRSNVFYIRIPFVFLSLFGIIYRLTIFEEKGELPGEAFKYFTIQTNLMVVIWLILSVVYKDGLNSANQEKMDKLYGSTKGAITSFITLTFLGYAFLLASTSTISGTELIASNINHYVIPIYFIIDWIITENKHYPIKYPILWLFYPLIYLAFAYVFQITTDDSIYNFFNIDEHGLDGFLTQAVTLLIGFTLFCFTYFGLNQVIAKEDSSEKSMQT